MKRHTFKIAGTVFLLAAVLCAPATADRGEVATADVAGGSLYWNVHVGYDGLKLTVAGEGRYVARTFEGGETPSFSIFDADGEPLADGTYKWELVVLPKLRELKPEEFENLRSSIDGAEVRDARAPERQVASGAFSVRGGQIVNPDLTEGPAAGPAEQGNVLSTKDFVISDDLIVQRSACIGFDCVNGESFGFDTIRLKENNLRIKFEDTSTSSGFPTTDWQLTANDSASGGLNKFSIEDISGARVPFTIEGGTPSHSLYVDSTSRIGLGTSTPILDLHVASGNTPGLRLEQDTSSGFGAQVFDIAGNEANFFVRDATNGSTLPFRIRPGAPTSSIDIAASGNVGVGTASPQVRLDVQTNASLNVVGRIQNKASDGFSGIEFLDHNDATKFFFGVINSDGSARLNSLGGGHMEFRTSNIERLRIAGNGNIGIGGVASPSHPIEHTSGAHLTAGGAWIDGSSRENKQDITRLTAEEATAALAGLDPVKFRYKAELDEEYVGFLAEDVPELVAVSSRTGLHAMDLVAVLTKVAQKQQEAIETQKEMIDTLLRKVEQLESER